MTVEFDNFYLLCGYVPNSGDGLRRLVQNFELLTMYLHMLLVILYFKVEDNSFFLPLMKIVVQDR